MRHQMYHEAFWGSGPDTRKTCSVLIFEDKLSCGPAKQNIVDMFYTMVLIYANYLD